MKIKIILTLILGISFIKSYSQDKLFKPDGTKLEVKVLEVNQTEVYKGCGLISDIDTFLLQYNFKRVLTNITPYGWGDALYIYVGN